MTAPRPLSATAGILIRVYPAGKARHVRITVESTGPVELDNDEIIIFLETAAEMMHKLEGTWMDPSQN